MTTYQFGYDGRRLTLAELNQRPTWTRLHPELRRRLVAMFDDARDDGRDLGIGQGWRSSAEQERTFRARYHVVTERPWDTVWNGQRWRKKAGVAAAAPPGRSYHEETTPDGHALAADLVGDLDWMNAHCGDFGLRHFANVNREPWHVQPIEIPTSRNAYRGQPLEVWRPNAEEITMLQLDYEPGTTRWVATLWTGTELAWVRDGHAAAVLEQAGVQRITVTRDQFLGVIRTSRTTTSAPPMEPTLVKAWNDAKG
jgi:hypothetical protein